jgi:hypothetical protein
MEVTMASALALLLFLFSSPCLGAHAGDEPNYMVVAANSMKHIAEGAVCSGHKGAYMQTNTDSRIIV